ncbi:MAG: 50S ribosomal protein L30 [Deltaproteobacteria bacterium]|nr:50S ribosomal protein L30 [Deltaproteobacteria bacterium]
MAGKKLKVTLIKSKSGQTERQIKTVHGLGLKKVNSSKVLNDTPAVRGLINKVAHLVTVESAVKGKTPKLV